MRKLVLNIFSILGISFLVLSLLLAASVFVDIKDKNGIMYAYSDKLELLEKTGGGGIQRIILIGGSNVPTGIDSERLEKQLDKTVINLGLTAMLGLKYMLDTVDAYVEEGDIVVIIPEYELLDETFEPNYLLFQSLLVAYMPLDAQQIKSMLLDYSTYVKIAIWKTVFKNEDNIFSRNGYNKYGDLVSHLDEPSIVKMAAQSRLRENMISIKKVAMLNKYAENYKLKKAEVYFCFPCYPETLASESSEILGAIEQMLRDNLEIEIISRPEDFVYPDDCFYDSKYHLNRLGRDLRTEMLIDKLKTVIK